MVNNNFEINRLRHLYYQTYQTLPYPSYYQELLHFPKVNPLSITADIHSLRFTHRLKGQCLFCKEHPSRYNLSFCYQREVWVMYSKPCQFNEAMALAQAVQASGAGKILLVLIAI
ncbi:MAG TPA: hypothetical protein VHE99_04030 [Gammaproteobacteria bacterium]|nr:hypothetical protein [Gammaproteobacteria bacterium]